MAEEVPFAELIRRVRRGDEEAATELVRAYEPAIRRAVRFRLGDARLARTCDSMDICQAVLASFFVRAASGQYELDTPEALLKLLAVMARNKLVKEVARQRAGRRDNRRLATDPVEGREVIGAEPSPSRHLAAKEMLHEVRRRLSPEERRLVELRAEGLEWGEIAAQMGTGPEALRKRLARAVGRVARELGLDEDDDG